WLELNNDRCRTEIENANRKGLRLVGYWHTHPQAVPHISGTDIASFARFARQNARDLPHPVAVIVGTSPSSTGIKAWIFREGRYQEAVYTAYLSRP
ncbi:Mov34/MPN/PAD-1 family protein, partial [Klebsiella pneumoniae]